MFACVQRETKKILTKKFWELNGPLVFSALGRLALAAIMMVLAGAAAGGSDQREGRRQQLSCWLQSRRATAAKGLMGGATAASAGFD